MLLVAERDLNDQARPANPVLAVARESRDRPDRVG
jgi:hypothetical protein